MAAEPAPAFPPIDFERFHAEELPQPIAEDAALAAGAARSAAPLGPLAFRLREGGAFTYAPAGDTLELRRGDADAATVIELPHAAWEGVVHELEAAAGLLYGGQARCAQGDGLRWLSWEPALRALYNGRPVWEGEDWDGDAAALRDRRGAPLDPERVFTLGDDPEDLAHFLRTAGYLFVRGVFAKDEVDAFLAEAEALRAEAVPGDRLSWWARNARGEEVLCRVTRAGARPRLGALPRDPRLLRLAALLAEPLAHRRKGRDEGEEGVSLIWKTPDMREGLSDIPWHRDFGMGGHAVMCPILIVSTYLRPATPETGELAFLPGSRDRGVGPIDPRHPKAPRGAHFRAGPGDVTVHYSDTMHAAPPPTRSDLPPDAYRLSAVTGFARPGASPHDGRRHYNEVLHRREDGQVEHLSVVARARG